MCLLIHLSIDYDFTIENYVIDEGDDDLCALPVKKPCNQFDTFVLVS